MKQYSLFRPCRGWLLALGLITAACASLSAQTVNSVTHLNNGYVLDADATDGDGLTNRHRISAIANVTIPTAGQTYRVVFDVLDAGNTSVATGTASIASYTANVPLNVTGSMDPAARLAPNTPYTTQARLQQLVTTNWVTQATFNDPTPREYWHFTNTANIDSPVNVIAKTDSASYARTWLLETMPNRRSIQVPVNYTLRRYDAFASAPVNTTLFLRVAYELRDDLNTLIHSGTQDTTVSCPTHGMQSIGGLPTPVAAVQAGAITLEIDPPTQLASASRSYYVKATISHIESGSNYTAGNSLTLANQRMLHFSGALSCGNINTLFISINNTPAAGSAVPPYVLSTIAIDPNSATLAIPGYTFGGGGALQVRLHDDGHAELRTGSYTVNGPVPDLDALGSVGFERGPITLNSNGATATISARLPAGVSYANTAASPVLESDLSFGTQTLTPTLDPTATSLTYTSAAWVTEETKPVRIATSAIEWLPGLSRFDLTATGASSVRKPLLDALNAATVNNAAMKLKRSNDHWWNGLNGTASAVSIKASPTRGGQMNGNLGLGAASLFTTHLPYNVNISAQSASTVSITDDEILSSSKLAGVQPTLIRYEQTCSVPDPCGGGSFTTSQSLSFANNELALTPDGGLHAVSTINSGGLIGWGYVDTLSRPSQNVDTPFTQGNFYACGHFLAGGQNSLPVDQAPLEISLLGRMPGALGTSERPGTPAYDAGLADYPGLNLRATAGQQGLSYLCGLPAGFGPYDLKPRSKYYTRNSGVSGIHDAVNGTFPTGATLFGYNFTFSNYGLSFLSNENVISRTNGAIVVPAPSNFQQQLEKISFTCRGSIKEAKVPAADGQKELDYWNVGFRTLGIKFIADSACMPSDARLVIAMETGASHVSDPLYGKVGFQPNGQLIRPSDNYANITSEFSLAGPFTIDGPTGEAYHINAVRGAYLNHAASTPAGPGFWNIAASVDVPFFEDLKAHIQLSGDAANTIAPVYMMGGWPRKDSGATNYGWASGPLNAKNYFTDSSFDADHTGRPAAVSVEAYFCFGKYHNSQRISSGGSSQGACLV